ncbi:MAG: GDP-mannose 4,6-dehydratase [Candidatus Omnitrophica bacterium]|nr:GDP-mannose 4,6-dehydratase [Candidatus Omnitrophota bacterium]
MKKVCVTGAGGFIGSHLAGLLLSGHEVSAFVRYVSTGSIGLLAEHEAASNLTVHRGDLRDVDAFRQAVAGCDTLLHLAAHISIPYSKIHPREVFDANTQMTMNALSVAHQEGLSRVVLISTSEVYGSAQTIPITEEHPLHPQSVYAASKVASDQLGLAWSRQIGGPEIVILRPFNTYGPGQSLRAVIPTIIRQALAGDEIHLGATSTTRDFVYVEDTARAILLAGEAPDLDGEVIHVGTGVETSVSEVVELVGEILNKKLSVISEQERTRGEKEEVERLVADPRRAKELLGWEAKVNLREGLERLVRELGEGAGEKVRYQV